MASPPAPDHSRDGESKKVEIITILSACCAVTTTLVVLRVITRARIIRAFGLDDWVVLAAQVKPTMSAGRPIVATNSARFLLLPRR